MTSPLSGIRVLDVSGYVSGPTCTAILASMGAEVIKVEPPGGDQIRTAGPFIGGVSYPFEMLHHNKKSIVVDLKTSEGVEIVRKLAAGSDIFLQNWRPGTADRLGVGYKDLREVNPALIYCSISAFGSTGPYGSRGGVDIVAQAMGGLMGVTGEPGRPPVKVSYPITDVGASLWSVIGILAALNVRTSTGVGQLVDVALLDSPVSWSFWEAAQYFGTGEVPAPLGSSHRNAVPYRAFECAGGDYLALGVASQDLWTRFCNLLHLERLADDQRFATVNVRRDNRTALEAELEVVFRAEDRKVWLDLLEPAGIPAGPVYKYDEMVNDPQVMHRGLIADVDHPTAGHIRMPQVPLFLSETPRAGMGPAPVLGADTQTVLKEAGFDDATIASWLASSVVAGGAARI